MEVILQNLGKKFSRQWIFKELSANIPDGGKCALVGYNGSGKSTLLQIISGARVPTAGTVLFNQGGSVVPREQAFKEMSYAAPYSDLVEELTLKEFFSFHTKFKKMCDGIDYISFKQTLQYDFRDDQVLKSFSSGMKQRVKLGIALLSESTLVLLDEPCSNLDVQGREWYHQVVDQYLGNRTLIIASNDAFEYAMVEQHISLDG